MRRSSKRLLILVVALPLCVLAAAVLYSLGMEHLEGDPRDFWSSVEWAAETLTTTGYGADSKWQHPLMIAYVVVLQFAGVFLVFLLFPIYLIPFLEERFEARLPREAPRKLRDHVVIYRHGSAVNLLLDELARAGRPYIIIEEDKEIARGLLERKRSVMVSRLDEGALEAARINHASALIANGHDAENAAVCLGARQYGFTGRILAMVEVPMHRAPLQLAGADWVVTPRHAVALALAARASALIGPRVSGLQQLGDQLAVEEVRILPGSSLAGKTLGAANIGTDTGAVIVGQWIEGKLDTNPTPATIMEARGVLVAVGTAESLEKLGQLAGSDVARLRTGDLIVAGFGEVGRKVVQLLRDAGEQVRVIDRDPADGIDVVGSAHDVAILEAVGVEESRGIVLALDNDASTLFATVIIRSMAADVPIVARVNDGENVQRIHRAGADTALSVSQVAGRLLTNHLLGEDAVSIAPRLSIVRVGAGTLAGKRPLELAIRDRTGCSVVVERKGQLLTELGQSFRFEPDDAVFVCGNRDAIQRYHAAFTDTDAGASKRDLR